MRHVDEIAAPGTPEREILEKIELQRLPRHIAIIMDGNGRWAGARNLPRVEGHRAGIRAVRVTVETVAALEIDVLTLYAFSTENWKRPRFEVLTLMGLLKEYLRAEVETFCHNNLRFRPIGRLEELDQSVQEELERAVKATAACTGPVVQIALNYSGRQELLDLIGEAVGLARSAKLDRQDLTEVWVNEHLATSGLPDPDLLIRTSGEQRISNFLLWQLAYAEIYFTQVLWPDFSKTELLKAILDYQQRDRRFGGLSPSERIFTPSGAPHAGS